MSKEAGVYPILTLPGIKRDGTIFDGNNHIDGKWTRWQRGRARKMGGYRQMSNNFTGPVRGCTGFLRNNVFSVYGGSASLLEGCTFDSQGVITGAITNRTPSGFAGSTNNLWQFDTIYNSSATLEYLIAHAAPNLTNIASTVSTPVYYGDSTATTALTAISGSDVSGGAVTLYPYLFRYGNDGFIGWSSPTDPTNISTGGAGTARVTGGKILKGFSARAGANIAPSGLFWATDALVRATFNGGSTVFNFDRITPGYSILSAQGILEYDGIYYWVGNGRFNYFNGSIKELPNNMNLNWFFDNLNYAQRQKVYGFTTPRWGEIGWAFPYGDATECTHAVICNVRENFTWYDTELPESGRTCYYTDTIFPNPIAFGAEIDSDGYSPLWLHESGVDKIVNNRPLAIESYYTKNDISLVADGPKQQPGAFLGVNRSIILNSFEPDFVMTGDMTLEVLGRAYAQSPFATGNSYTFSPSTEFISPRDQFREMYLRFRSNVQGGDFQEGQNLISLEIGSGQPK